jgi:hypothetical protein
MPGTEQIPPPEGAAATSGVTLASVVAGIAAPADAARADAAPADADAEGLAVASADA